MPNDASTDRPLLPRVAVGVAMMAVGLTLVVAVSGARQTTSQRDRDLHQMVTEREASVSATEEEIVLLNGKIEALGKPATQVSSAETPLLAQSVSGPGVRVILDDAPPDVPTDGQASVNDLVVHQEDVDNTMNALWRGGAEAMAVQGVRVTPNTPVRCIGNVILVGSGTYAPPYRIEAIGDPSALTAAVENDKQVLIYRQYADRYRLGWAVEESSDLTFPPMTEVLQPKFAQKTQEQS